MGSLENARTLARTVGDTIAKVQGPRDVHLMMDHIRKKFAELQKNGPQDLWWKSVRALYDDCVQKAPQACVTLAEHAQWAEHMCRFWLTVLSARAIIVAWAGTDPTKEECHIHPSSSLISARNVTMATDFPKGQNPTKIETIGNETLAALQKRHINCFDPWTSVQYRTRLSFALLQYRAKILHHERDTGLLCGFYTWMQRTPIPPLSAMPMDRTIGTETLHTRTLWPEEIVPERIGFRHTLGGHGITSITEEEAALRVAIDLMKVAIDAQLPLVLPEKRAAP